MLSVVSTLYQLGAKDRASGRAPRRLQVGASATINAAAVQGSFTWPNGDAKWGGREDVFLVLQGTVILTPTPATVAARGGSIHLTTINSLGTVTTLGSMAAEWVSGLPAGEQMILNLVRQPFLIMPEDGLLFSGNFSAAGANNSVVAYLTGLVLPRANLQY